MSDKPNGSGKGYCDVCHREYRWGCGHSGSQESAARRHIGTQRHKDRQCECFGHDYCDPRRCKLAGIQQPGYAPFHQHTPDPRSLGGGGARSRTRAPSRKAKRSR